MNVDHILGVFNRERVEYLLIGGLNYALRHVPYTTLDIDLWIEDTEENRTRCETALSALDAEWGPTDATWEAVKHKQPGWLATQSLYCLRSPHGWIDVFRKVKGLADWKGSKAIAIHEQTLAGTSYWGLSDADMLKCQLALDPTLQKRDRIAILQHKLGGTP
jgi:hypothetical protein